MAILKPFSKGLSLILAVVYFSTNSLFGYSPESGFWSERNRAAREHRGGGTLVASLPGSRGGVGSAIVLPSLGVQIPALAPQRLRHLPFVRDHKEVFSALSPNLATVRDVSFPTKMTPMSPLVIHIQDVHHNLDAQRKIAALTRALTEGADRPVDVVALEGAWETIDPTPFREFSDRATVEQTMDQLLQGNKISGPVYAACTGSGPFPSLVGVDDSIHHGANVEAYRRAVPEMGRVQAVLKDQRALLEKEKPTVYSEKLLHWDAVVESYHSGGSSLGAYVTALVAHSPHLPPTVADFKRAFDLEKTINFQRVEQERTELLRALVGRLDKRGHDELLAQALAHRTGHLGYGDFYTGLESLCASAGVPLDRYSEFRRYIRYALTTDSVRAELLFHELALLERRVYSALVQTPSAGVLVEKVRALRLMEKLADFSLTPTEWKDYGAIRNTPEVVSVNLAPFENFYEEAGARDGVMAENLLRALRSRVNPGESRASLALLVSGGYHAPGLTERFNAAGAVVISVVPKIDKIDSPQGSHYLSVFSREKTPLDKLFVGQKLFLATPPATGVLEAPFWIGLLKGSAQTAKELYHALRRPVRLIEVKINGESLVATFENAEPIIFSRNGNNWSVQATSPSWFEANFRKPWRELSLPFPAHLSTQAAMTFIQKHLNGLDLGGNPVQIEKIFRDWLAGIHVWFRVGTLTGFVATGSLVALLPLNPWFWLPVFIVLAVPMVLSFHLASHVLYNIFHPQSRSAIGDEFSDQSLSPEIATLLAGYDRDLKTMKLVPGRLYSHREIHHQLTTAFKHNRQRSDEVLGAFGRLKGSHYLEVRQYLNPHVLPNSIIYRIIRMIFVTAQGTDRSTVRNPHPLPRAGEGETSGPEPLSNFTVLGNPSQSVWARGAEWMGRNDRWLGLVGLLWEIPNLLHAAGAPLPPVFDHVFFQFLPVMDPLGLTLFLAGFWMLHQLVLALELAQGLRARAGPVNFSALWIAWRQAVPAPVALLSLFVFVPYIVIPFLAPASAMPWWVLLFPAVPHLIWDVWTSSPFFQSMKTKSKDAVQESFQSGYELSEQELQERDGLVVNILGEMISKWFPSFYRIKNLWIQFRFQHAYNLTPPSPADTQRPTARGPPTHRDNSDLDKYLDSVQTNGRGENHSGFRFFPEGYVPGIYRENELKRYLQNEWRDNQNFSREAIIDRQLDLLVLEGTINGNQKKVIRKNAYRLLKEAEESEGFNPTTLERDVLTCAIVRTVVNGGTEFNPFQTRNRKTNEIAAVLQEEGVPLRQRLLRLMRSFEVLKYFTNEELYSSPAVLIAERVREKVRAFDNSPLLIDAFDSYTQRVVYSPSPITVPVFFDDNGEAVFVLKFLLEQIKMNKQLRFALVARNGQYREDASVKDLQMIMDMPTFKQDVKEAGDRLRVFPGCAGDGIDLRKISKELAEVISSAEVVLSIGQMNFEGLNGFKKDVYFLFVPTALGNVSVTGVLKGNGIFAYLPAGNKAFSTYTAKTFRYLVFEDGRTIPVAATTLIEVAGMFSENIINANYSVYENSDMGEDPPAQEDDDISSPSSLSRPHVLPKKGATGWIGVGLSRLAGEAIWWGWGRWGGTELSRSSFVRGFMVQHAARAEDLLNVFVSVGVGWVAAQNLDLLAWLSLGTLSPPGALFLPVFLVLGVWFVVFVGSHLVAPKILEKIIAQKPSGVKAVRLFGFYLVPLLLTTLGGGVLASHGWGLFVSILIPIGLFRTVRSAHERINLEEKNSVEKIRLGSRLSVFLGRFIISVAISLIASNSLFARTGSEAESLKRPVKELRPWKEQALADLERKFGDEAALAILDEQERLVKRFFPQLSEDVLRQMASLVRPNQVAEGWGSTKKILIPELWVVGSMEAFRTFVAHETAHILFPPYSNGRGISLDPAFQLYRHEIHLVIYAMGFLRGMELGIEKKYGMYRDGILGWGSAIDQGINPHYHAGYDLAKEAWALERKSPGEGWNYLRNKLDDRSDLEQREIVGLLTSPGFIFFVFSIFGLGSLVYVLGKKHERDGVSTSQWGLLLAEWLGARVGGVGGRERFGATYQRFAALIEWSVSAKIAFWGFVGTIAFVDVALGWALAPLVGALYGVLFVASHFIPQSMAPVTSVQVGVLKTVFMGLIYGVLIGVTPFLLGAVPLLGVPEFGVQAAGVLWGMAGFLHHSFDLEKPREAGEREAWKFIGQVSRVQGAFEVLIPVPQANLTEQLMGKESSSVDPMTETLSRLETDREFRAGFVGAVQEAIDGKKLSGTPLVLVSTLLQAATGQPLSYLHVLGESPVEELENLELMMGRSEGPVSGNGLSVALVVSKNKIDSLKGRIDVLEAKGVTVFTVALSGQGWTRDVLTQLDHRMSPWFNKASGIVATVGAEVGIRPRDIEALDPESKLRAALETAVTLGDVIRTYLRYLQVLASNA
jgi:uncharacterized protein with ATP-grasp and redox domains